MPCVCVCKVQFPINLLEITRGVNLAQLNKNIRSCVYYYKYGYIFDTRQTYISCVLHTSTSLFHIWTSLQTFKIYYIYLLKFEYSTGSWSLAISSQDQQDNQSHNMFLLVFSSSTEFIRLLFKHKTTVYNCRMQWAYIAKEVSTNKQIYFAYIPKWLNALAYYFG